MEKKPNKVVTFLKAIGVIILFLLAITLGQTVVIVIKELEFIKETQNIDFTTFFAKIYSEPGLLSNAQFVGEIVSLVIFGCWYASIIRKEKKLGTYESPVKKLASLKNILFIIIASVTASFGVVVVYNILKLFIADQVAVMNESMGTVAGQNILGLISIMLLAPIVEELAVRGVILKISKKSYKLIGCMVISAICFSLFHMNVVQGIYTIPLGLMFGFLAYKFNSVIPSIIGHLIHNCFGGYIVLLLKTPIIIIVTVILFVVLLMVGKNLEVLKNEKK